MWKLSHLLLAPLFLLGCYLGNLPSSVQEEQSQPIPKSVHEGFKVEVTHKSMSSVDPSKVSSKLLGSSIRSLKDIFTQTDIQTFKIEFDNEFKVYLQSDGSRKDEVRLSARNGVTVFKPSRLEIDAKIEQKIYSIVYQIEEYIGELDKELNPIEDFIQLWPMLSQTKHYTKISINMPESKLQVAGAEILVKDRIVVEFLSHNKIELSGAYIKAFGDKDWSPLIAVEIDGDSIEYSFVDAKSNIQKLTHNRKQGVIAPLAFEE